MPSIQEATSADLSKYTPVEPVVIPQVSLPPASQSGVNPMMRSPMPPIWQATPDSLRQFTNNNVVPQNRIFNPPSVASKSGGNTTVNNYVSSSSSGGGTSGNTGGGSSTNTPVTKQTAVVTSTLGPGQVYKGVLQCAKAFQLLSVAATGACRIQLYGTKQAQSFDASRGLDVPPPAGSFQNIICDLAIDTAPYTWGFQSRMGANADSPQIAAVYVTITNISTTTTATLGITFSYVPLES